MQGINIEEFEQLINISAGKQLSVPKAHQRKARKPLAFILKTQIENDYKERKCSKTTI